MSDFNFPSRPSLFSRTLRECRDLYLSAGHLIASEHPGLVKTTDGDFVQLMDDLHRTLVMKIYLTLCEADQTWSKEERFLAEVLCHHLFDQWLEGEQLSATMKRASTEAAKLKWYSMIRPFDQLAPLRPRISELETIIARLANLIARADGALNDAELAAIKSLQDEISSQLKEIPLDENSEEQEERSAGAIEQQRAEEPTIYTAANPHLMEGFDTGEKKKNLVKKPDDKPAQKPEPAKPAAEPPKVTLDEALAELDGLIGLDNIKHEIRSLTNFLQLQKKREAAGLPETDISLHMVFTGNPGTGKTTVARIVGKIFGAMGILAKGHLIETDRSGLVAEYAGQTGPKTQKKVDEALDGILFIDEAYSLVAQESEDPYGREAIQALLKRAEDDRKRLVVILAGYTNEMEQLLLSNPGLSSRFNRQLEFVDYTPLEMSRIFGFMVNKNHYLLSPDARLKIMLGLKWQYDHRDRHFGNGRSVRNTFEQAIRRMANRLATKAELTQEELMTLTGPDIEFAEVPAEAFEAVDQSLLEVRVRCPKCEHSKAIPPEFLGQKLKCPKCGEQFAAEWGDLAALAGN